MTSRFLYALAAVAALIPSPAAAAGLSKAEQAMVQTKLTAAQNLVTTYQTIGGDALLQGTPVCQALPGDSIASKAKLASQCSPI